MKYLKQVLAGSGLLCVSLGAAAVPMYDTHYSANLVPFNHSGVTGHAALAYNASANTLNVKIHATGLEHNMPHQQHIHGLLSGPRGETGTPINSVNPPPIAADTDGDGFDEFKNGEVLPYEGPVLVGLTSTPGGDPFTGPFPTAPDGTIDYNQNFDLSDPGIYNTSPANGQRFDKSQLFPLTDRLIDIHSMTVSAGVGAGTSGEVNGTGGYKLNLPVAGGMIVKNGMGGATSAVPEPSDFGMLLFGVSLIGSLAFARKRGYFGGAPRA